MSRHWVLALTGLGAEPMVVSHLGERRPAVRRVTDLVELLAVAQPALADGVLISARFPQMSRDVAQRLARSGMPVWGLFDPGDDVGERMIQDWGVTAVAATSTTDVDTLLAQAQPPQPGTSPGGALVAVTGPAGAPGRSTVALNLAAEWADRCLLVDADTRAPSLGFQLGLPADAPGTRGAGRQAAAGRLTPVMLAAACHDVESVTVLPGGPPGSAVPASDGLLDVCLRTRPITVVDCGQLDSCDDTTIGSAALARAQVVILVAAPTALGIRRLADEVPRVRTATASPVVVVWNQVRTRRQHGGLGADPMQRLTAFTRSVAPEAVVTGLPWDPRAMARTVSGTLRRHAPCSDLCRGVSALAGVALGELRADRVRERADRHR